MSAVTTGVESTPQDKQFKIPDFTEFKDASTTIKKLVGMMDDQEQVLKNNRQLRYTEIDIEAERKSGRIAPDELYIPQHTIDTNVRREQSVYVTYVVQPARAAVFVSLDDPLVDTSPLERDFTNRYRYDGWQGPQFRNIDSFQMNGYAVMELVHDQSKPGHLALQDVSYGDFGYSLDTKDIQQCEMVVRRYYFTKTQLIGLTKDDGYKFDRTEVEKVVSTKDSEVMDYKEISLFKVEKVMFRKEGVVYVAWSCELHADDWLREPRPLFLGRMRPTDPSNLAGTWVESFETLYPYFIFPYNITENTIIRESKGRAYLDQDSQEALSSLLSSFVTAHRRASYLVFGKDSDDPNADVATQSNVLFKPGALIPSKIKQFQLIPPGPDMISGIQLLATSNAQETSQINYAANNRKDSRKTATEVQAASLSSQQLSAIQVSLFSLSCKNVLGAFWTILRSRVLAQLIQVPPQLLPLYAGNYLIRPSGDTDVIERQQKIQTMQTAWPVVQNTPLAQTFLIRLIALMFPDEAPLFMKALQVDDLKTNLLKAAFSVLQALVNDPTSLSQKEYGNLPQLMQLLQQMQQVLAPQQQQGQPSNNGGGAVQQQLPGPTAPTAALPPPALAQMRDYVNRTPVSMSDQQPSRRIQA